MIKRILRTLFWWKLTIIFCQPFDNTVIEQYCSIPFCILFLFFIQTYPLIGWTWKNHTSSPFGLLRKWINTYNSTMLSQLLLETDKSLAFGTPKIWADKIIIILLSPEKDARENNFISRRMQMMRTTHVWNIIIMPMYRLVYNYCSGVGGGGTRLCKFHCERMHARVSRWSLIRKLPTANAHTVIVL